VGTIDIPVIGLDQVVVEGVGASQLAVGPGHYPGTPLPGQAGNAAIAGHRTTHGRPFYDLNELGVGDRITVTTLQGVFHYRVSRSEIVAPDDVAVLDASTTPELTLTTCNPRYSAAQRLVVVARLVATGGPAPSTGSGPGATTGVLPGEAAADPLTDPADWLWLVLWSVALLAVVAAVLVVRHRPGRRWPLLVAAVPVGLVILFFWFGAVSTMLPATF
jgi:sortase A